MDNNNIAAKKELFDVEKAIKVYAKQERAAMSNMFSSGKSMYEDKEKERLLKIRKEEVIPSLGEHPNYQMVR